MGLSTFFGLVAIALIVVVLSKLNDLHREVKMMREELGRRRE